jgi:predicted O-methyltransferase YrrM
MSSPRSLRARIAPWIERARFGVARACMPHVANCEDGLLSMIYPVSEAPAGDSKQAAQMLDLALAAARDASAVDLRDVADRISHGPRWPEVWPGEHYRLLTALAARLQPRTVVEIGTFLGLSALAIRKGLPAGGKVVTFDVLPWDSFAGTCLRASDFADGRLEQVVGDLADPQCFHAHAPLLQGAGMIFLDGPKNRSFEQAFLRQLAEIRFSSPALLVIDDIRLWSMLDIWRGIAFPKLDVTSLGHFSGTGLVWLGPAKDGGANGEFGA